MSADQKSLFVIMPAQEQMLKRAKLSPDGKYRWWLTREWSDEAKPSRACWVMLNPSTADDKIDDPTIRRCISFTKRRGFGALIVVNLFALRSTDPKALKNHYGPDHDFGEENAVIMEATKNSHEVICAWGNGGGLLCRGDDVGRMLERAGVVPLCFGTTGAEEPRHPLYVRSDEPVTMLPTWADMQDVRERRLP